MSVKRVLANTVTKKMPVEECCQTQPELTKYRPNSTLLPDIKANLVFNTPQKKTNSNTISMGFSQLHKQKKNEIKNISNS